MRIGARRWLAQHRRRVVIVVALVGLLLALVTLTSLHTLAWNTIAQHCGAITVWDAGYDQATHADDPAAASPAVTCFAQAFRACAPAGLEVRERGTDWAFSRLWVVEPHLGGCDASAGTFTVAGNGTWAGVFTWARALTCHGQRWAMEQFPYGFGVGERTEQGLLLSSCGDHGDVFLPITAPPRLASY